LVEEYLVAVAKISDFDGIADEFRRRAHAATWCSVATVDSRGRPRSRVLHPIWEGRTGWIGTRRSSFKARHLALNPHVSLTYMADLERPVYVDCVAEWADDRADREHAWNLFLHAPPPLGYDPAPIFKDLDGFGLLRLIPWRIDLVDTPFQRRVWRADR
jgi:hypothetical protein